MVSRRSSSASRARSTSSKQSLAGGEDHEVEQELALRGEQGAVTGSFGGDLLQIPADQTLQESDPVGAPQRDHAALGQSNISAGRHLADRSPRLPLVRGGGAAAARKSSGSELIGRSPVDHCAQRLRDLPRHDRQIDSGRAPSRARRGPARAGGPGRPAGAPMASASASGAAGGTSRPSTAVTDDLARPRDVGRDRRPGMGHALQHHDAERLLARRHAEQVERLEEASLVVIQPRNRRRSSIPRRACERPQLGLLGPAAREPRLEPVAARAQARERLDQVGKALLRHETAERADHRHAVRVGSRPGPLPAACAPGSARP